MATEGTTTFKVMNQKFVKLDRFDGHILNTLSDRLYDLYMSMQSPVEIWKALEEKYNTERQGAIISKLPSSWKNYQNKLLHMAEDFTVEKILMHLHIEEET
ncbi:hypothetical protein CXB51_026463 [Gossypium anomalum]|uniref:UBN2_3 domain-containing protein n=1 Tax=Gossypium anomalum TaxID=47600 RepID=A0A8J5Y342_9ROSI|nr:hypothetical protein CXB51_026463 [Gossypium anomalum]